ncbi:uncharacterized protein LOC110238056 [Exaiptasia diaphana]|uniref:RING-type domain-containing protein n=1 Tax=Exaiptasia diaphana TaxID=2652724 RepID=A0A913X5T6_EXADI|nr:uncharacterized protein LOC110238056 [Exaiptasia diaphana]KXJ14965.1 hypothetical protein AC249_AIPGENE14475 [Exaiptasia diaphana]
MLSGFSSFIKRHSTTVIVGVGLSLAVPAAYAIYRYLKNTNQQANAEASERRGEKLNELRGKLERLLVSLEQIVPEVAENEDEECIVCNSSKAVIQTFPCKHKVLCRTCFVRTLQVAVTDFNLPLKCVLCRTRIATLDRERHEENAMQSGSSI